MIAFLNTITAREKGKKIADVTMVDTNNHPETNTAKYSIVDIKCVDERGVVFIVEMQVINQPDFLDRCQFYASKEVVHQLDKGDRYQKLNPVILVGIANFTLFDNQRYLSHHYVLDIDSHQNELDLMQYHFLELSKFNKTLEQLDSVVDQWAYFLKHASEFDEIPSELKKNNEIAHAFEVLETANFNRAELATYDKQVDALRLEVARTEEAKKEGHAEGREEGRAEERIELAKKLLKRGDTIEEISDLTGLSVEVIKILKVD